KRCAWANVQAGAVQKILLHIPIKTKAIRFVKGTAITIGGNPHQRDSFACADLPAMDFHRPGRDSPTGNEGAVNPQDLLDGGRQELRFHPKLRLKVRVSGKIVGQY